MLPISPAFRHRVLFFLPVLLLAMTAALPSRVRAEEPAAVPLFNGTDLTGWKVPTPNPFWSVKDGVLTGTNDSSQKGSMLWTEKNYGDFELEAEAKWEGDIDSGFMMRKPELQVQLGVSRSLKTDMTACFYLGKYPEEGQAKERAKLLKVNDWNHFKIRAEGGVFTVWMNGAEAVVFKNTAFAAPGPVGLQIHAGLPMSIAFRNIKIKEFSQ